METKLKCTRPGCQKEYKEDENSDTACYYHDGKPIFHDIKKGWTCCEVIVYDWDEFMKISGCKIGRHLSSQVADKTEFFKSQTVSNAQKGIDSAENNIVIKDVKEFEKEQQKIDDEKKIKESQKPKEILVIIN